MRGHCRRVRARRDDKLAITQCVQGGLHGALGESRFLRDHAQAHCHRPPALARGAAKQEKINQERRRLLIVRDEITHQNVEHIVVHGDGGPKARHDGIISTIPINGQQFSLRRLALSSTAAQRRS